MMAGASAPSPFYPVLAQRLGFDAIVITSVFAVYALALLLTLLAAGSLSDHVGRRPVIIAGLVLGKPIGIVAAPWLTTRARGIRPR